MFCSNCNKEIPQGGRFCRYCGSIQKEVGDLKPANNGSSVDSKLVLLPTTGNRRLVNWLLDLVFMYLSAIPIGFVLALTGVYSVLKIDSWNETILGWLLYFLYYFITEALWGKSIAKFITKTRVVRIDGSELGASKIFVRTLCRFIPFDQFSFLSGSRPIGWHDKLSGTAVIDDAQYELIRRDGLELQRISG